MTKCEDNQLLDIVKEKSCGAIVYKKEDTISFLILKHNAGHFSFPKGHVEKNESEVETAIREIKEETNLDVLVNDSFRVVSTYRPSDGIIKDVIFFLAEAKSFEVIPQDSEIDSIKWYSYVDAMEMLTYQKDKELLKEAYEFLLK